MEYRYAGRAYYTPSISIFDQVLTEYYILMEKLTQEKIISFDYDIINTSTFLWLSQLVDSTYF